MTTIQDTSSFKRFLAKNIKELKEHFEDFCDEMKEDGLKIQKTHEEFINFAITEYEIITGIIK